MDKVAVVTGSSTGIGFETLLLARNGFHTYATIRNPIIQKEEWLMWQIERNLHYKLYNYMYLMISLLKRQLIR